MEISNKTAANLSNILGEISFKSVGSDLFLPMIELLSELSDASEKADALRAAVLKQYDLQPDAKGAIMFPDMDMANEVTKQFENISDRMVSIEDSALRLLTKEHIKLLSDENPKLQGKELLDIRKYLVKN